jgi:hypothetical protein
MKLCCATASPSDLRKKQKRLASGRMGLISVAQWLGDQSIFQGMAGLRGQPSPPQNPFGAP